MINDRDTLQLTVEEEVAADADTISLQCKDASDEEVDPEEEVEEEDEVGDDDEFFKEKTLKSCLRSRPCSVCLYLCLTLLILASIVALVVVSVLIVTPFVRVVHFSATQCIVISVESSEGHYRCSCGKGCHSLYPCLEVKVMHSLYNVSEDGLLIYEDESMLDKQVSAA